MRISVAITDFSWPGPATELARHLTDVAEAAEAGSGDQKGEPWR